MTVAPRPHPFGLSPVLHAARPYWRLAVQQGTALVAQHGGQVLSWLPTGGKEVLWLSPQALPPPAATRGGVPICWPWFGRQGMPEGAMQHGPVRNRPWQPVGAPAVTDTRIALELEPQAASGTDDPLHRFAPGLALRLRITLDDALTLELHTHNQGSAPFVLTQALHTYLAVEDVRAIAIPELAHRPFLDKLRDHADPYPPAAWRYDGPCDRIYLQGAGRDTHHRYTLQDPLTPRQTVLQTIGSASVVLWNPGPAGAQALADVPDGAWQQFVCLETSNAASDTVELAPGARHRLQQRLAIQPLLTP